MKYIHEVKKQPSASNIYIDFENTFLESKSVPSSIEFIYCEGEASQVTWQGCRGVFSGETVDTSQVIFTA